MLKAAVLLEEDHSVLLIRVEIKRRRLKRGDGRGFWRGEFSIPTDRLTALMGPTIRLKFDDGTSVPAVVTRAKDLSVGFRAPGSPPRKATKRRNRLQTAG